MDIRNVAKVLVTVVEKKAPISVCIWGDPGIGKSAIVSQVAKKVGYDFFPLILSQREAVDLLGVPQPEFDKEVGINVTDYAPPRWFARALKKGRMVLFLDELNRARPEVIKAAFELVNERRLNGMKLPDDVVIVVACNPDNGEHQVESFDEAMTDRFMHIHAKASFSIWKEWAETESATGMMNVHADIVGFLNTAQEHAFKKSKDSDDFPVEIKQTFRSWERASHVHKLGLSESLELECLQGVVGTDIALAFMKSLKDQENKPLTAEEVLEFSKKTEAKVAKWTQNNDTSKMSEARLDVLKETVNALTKFVLKNEEETLNKAKTVMKFLNMLPDDLLIVAVTALHDNKEWATHILEDQRIASKLEEISETLNKSQAAPSASKKTTKKT